MEDLEIYQMIEKKVEEKTEPIWTEISGMRNDIREVNTSILKMEMTLLQKVTGNGEMDFAKTLKTVLLVGGFIGAIVAALMKFVF